MTDQTKFFACTDLPAINPESNLLTLRPHDEDPPVGENAPGYLPAESPEKPNPDHLVCQNLRPQTEDPSAGENAPGYQPAESPEKPNPDHLVCQDLR